MFPLEGHPFRLLSGTVPSHTTIWTSHVLCLLDSSNLPFTTKNPKPEFPFLLQYFLLLVTRATMHFPGKKPRIMGKKIKTQPVSRSQTSAGTPGLWNVCFFMLS